MSDCDLELALSGQESHDRSVTSCHHGTYQLAIARDEAISSDEF